MAPRAISSGTISFGLVAIPVKLYTTGESANTVRFNMVHKSCGTRLKYQYYCPTDDVMVPRDEIAKGYEFTKGQYVLFSDEELKALQPESTGSIEIAEFVPLEKVDPIFFATAYFLGPDKGGDKPYRLLSEALTRSGRAALGQYSARGKTNLVLLRPFERGLVLQQLRYVEDMRSFDEVPVGSSEIVDAELELAMRLIEQTAKDSFSPETYVDEGRRRIWQLVERKVQGEEIIAVEEPEPTGQIIDLMDALKASLAPDSSEKSDRRPPKRAAAKRVAKKKKATKKRASTKKS